MLKAKSLCIHNDPAVNSISRASRKMTSFLRRQESSIVCVVF